MTFFKRVLVAVDDSTPSQYAIDASLRVGRADGAALVFAVVLDPCLLSEDCSFASIRQLAEETASRILHEACTRAEQIGIEATSQVFFDDPVHGIIALAASGDTGLIVMGTHTRSGITRALNRSIAEAVLRQTTTPLCVVRKQPVGERHRHLLVAIANDDLSAYTIEYATQAAKSLGSHLTFCTVAATRTDETEQYLRSAQEHAVEAGVQADWIVVPRLGDLSGDILQQAQVGECDAIVMASHARDGLSRLIEGSVAETVIRYSDLPVVVLRESRRLA
ncbi:MAG TPA: universal stress protein [Candidatus Binatia bacterium]|nr:universal stress protein [Candidatus Binatia bacterium]